jgi:hypothetical protein
MDKTCKSKALRAKLEDKKKKHGTKKGKEEVDEKETKDGEKEEE